MRAWKRPAAAVAGAVVLVLGGVAAVAATTSAPTANCTAHPTVQQTTFTGNPTGGSRVTVVCTVPNPPAKTVTATVTKTVTSSPSPSQSPTPTPTPSSSPPAVGWACTVALGSNCGPYRDADIPMSNGSNTYVSNQPLNVHGTETIHANSPADWNVVANLSSCGGCVQTYASVQQLTQDWNPKADGTPAWGGNIEEADTPVNQLAALKINYDETSPASGASYEYAADVWIHDYAGLNNPGGGDIMFWVDTHGRCDDGAYGPTLLGHITIDGQGWTVHRYGDYGDEIIAVLDGAGGPGSCAQQSSGSINVKAGLQAMQDNGWILARAGDDAHPMLDNLDAGWEITQASDATFTVRNYSITVN